MFTNTLFKYDILGSLKCNWKVYKNSVIKLNDNKSLFGKSVDECKKHCEEETGFQCATFDYDKTKSRCYLSELTYNTAKQKYLLRTMQQYDIYECTSQDMPAGKQSFSIINIFYKHYSLLRPPPSP